MPKRQRRTRQRVIQSNTYRFFVEAAAFHGRVFTLDDDTLAHQLGSVLRLQPGDQVLLLDNSGWQYVVQLTELDRRHVAGVIEQKELAGGEPRTKLALYTAMMRPDRFEWVLQKGTELGATAFVPLICQRSTIADADELSDRRVDRWNRVIREAAEQARRGKLPRLSPALFFPSACEQAARRGTALLLWEGAGVPSLRETLRRLNDRTHPGPNPFTIALFSGPEGGFTESEVETARSYGIMPVTLGPRTLRAETAPLAAAAAILYELGDLE